ncbi:response regulator transcription factor [Sorangium sp. So ce861]|uniref:helix-turn-helix transcriptional regulator n=1 Tax=Sorangium sp. So ce861 TaxID=3133323 RepID=UPI003F60E623
MRASSEGRLAYHFRGIDFAQQALYAGFTAKGGAPMGDRVRHCAHEQRLIVDFLQTLHASLDLRTVIDTAFPILLKVVPAEHGALCVSRQEDPGSYDWSMVDFPVDWFSTYEEMVRHDFVRQAVLRQPNTVLRDSEMITRKELRANMMYRRALDVHMPLEHVMSVMLDFGQSWHAGVTLYRGRQRPFSDDERDLLQQIVPSLANAVQNCKLFADASRTGPMLDAILQQQGIEAVMVGAGCAEVARTRGATALISRWFAPVELNRAGLPVPLIDQLSAAMRKRAQVPEVPTSFTRLAPSGIELQITFVQLPEGASPATWAMVLQENPLLPAAWREILTQRQSEIASRVVLGWDNRLIADELGCTVATVKKHVLHIYDKLGVSSRTALCRAAQQDPAPHAAAGARLQRRRPPLD